jgi:CheY-like chemotaxis protein
MARILIVEDDPDTCDMVAHLIRRAGHEPVTAGDGLEALIALDTARSIDLILLDVMMPGVDGPTFLKILRDSRSHRSAPVLVMSASDREYVERRVARLDVEGVLTKSVNFVRDLIGVLDRHFGVPSPRVGSAVA